MTPVSDLPYWVGFNRVMGVGIIRLRRLIDAFGDARSAWEAPEAQLAAMGLHGRALSSLTATRRTFDPVKEMARLAEREIEVVTIEDEAYPALLKEIYAAPPVLFVKGALPKRDDVLVSVVGTRHATTYGRTMTERLVGDLAAAGVVIVSGFARGIDTHAHRAALDAGGRTIAVFACGIDTIYPPENREQAKRIPTSGALVSEHRLGVRPEATNFPARNRIVSGVSKATLVVEAGDRSGALITAQFALDQGRDVLAVPGPATSPRSAGTNRLIQEGARLVTSARDILDELGMTSTSDKAAQSRLSDLLPLDDDEKSVLAKLADEPLIADDLASALGRSVQDVAATLTMLELRGHIRQVAGLNYKIG